MKTIRLAHLLTATAILGSPSFSKADSTVTVDVQIKGGSASGLKVPMAGTYVFLLRPNQTEVTLPDGTVRIIDFAKKFVATLNPTQKTYSQQGIGEFLRQGDTVATPIASRFEAKTKFSYDFAQGQENRPILGQSAAPYSLDLEVLLSKVAGARQPLRMRRNQGFQAGIPGTPAANQIQPASLGVSIGGIVWVATFVPDGCDPVQLSTAELCAFLPGLPGLKNLNDRFRFAKSTMLAADLSISVLDSNGVAPTAPPVVSTQITSITLTHVDPNLFLIPADFLRVSPLSYSNGL